MRPLEGVRVLDLTRLIPGPFGSLVLADLGAHVDKIEDAGIGDYLRAVPPHKGAASVAFHALNRGKRSAIVDLKNPAGRDAFERLLGRYDVLFEQFRPGVLARLGLSHATLLERYPKLIICALTGYGQTGPLAQRAGHDLNYLARAGLLASHGPRDGAPQVPGFQMADVSGGLWCALAILAALRERDNSVDGKGTVLDIAMTDGVLGFASLSVAAGMAGSAAQRGDDTLTGGIAPYNTYMSKDGAPITLASLEPKFWMRFCAGVGIDPDMMALMPGPHQAALKTTIAQIFASRTRDEWERFAAEHDCCVEPARTLEEILDDPHHTARDIWFDIEADGESMPQFRTPVTPTDTAFTPAPKPGEHTDVVFAEAGFSADEVAALRQSGAIR